MQHAPGGGQEFRGKRPRRLRTITEFAWTMAEVFFKTTSRLLSTSNCLRIRDMRRLRTITEFTWTMAEVFFKTTSRLLSTLNCLRIRDMRRLRTTWVSL
jgi:hypothetical protein